MCPKSHIALTRNKFPQKIQTLTKTSTCTASSKCSAVTISCHAVNSHDRINNCCCSSQRASDVIIKRPSPLRIYRHYYRSRSTTPAIADACRPLTHHPSAPPPSLTSTPTGGPYRRPTVRPATGRGLAAAPTIASLPVYVAFPQSAVPATDRL